MVMLHFNVSYGFSIKNIHHLPLHSLRHKITRLESDNQEPSV
jgi:hypothetical protein